MSSPRIEVEIVAKVEGLAAGVNTATGQLDKLGKSAEGTAPKIGKLSQATGNYNAVGVNFARLIQDAPFGIIGVGNNITALAESFDQARNQGQSFTQILGGIFSTGNLVTLGISALVTAWTLYSQSTEKVVDLNEEARESYKELANQVEKTADILGTLKFVTDIITAQQDEVRKLTGDYSIFTSTAEENAKITSDAFAKLNKTQLTQIKSTLSELADDNLKKLGNSLDLTRKEAIKFAESFKGNVAGFEALTPNIRDTVSAYNSLSNQIKVAGKQLEFYDDKEEKIDFRKEALDRYSKAWDEYNLRLEESTILTDRVKEENEELSKKLQKVNKAFFDLPTKPIEVKIKTEGIDLEQDIPDQLPFEDQLIQALNPKRFSEFEERTAEFATNIRDLLQNNVTASFIDLGYTIGETLASGGNIFKAVGQSVLKSFARFLGQFGEQLIAYGVAATAFGKVSLALATPGGALIAAPLAIAAGIALTAIAGAIGGLGKKGPGGGGGGGSVGSSGVGGGSSFTGTGAQGGMFAANRDLNGELVVRGQDLVYVFGQANNRINKG
jgi:methyl-accepting chemotaxis protein